MWLVLANVLTGLLERVLFANIRFHDTINRGRLLNRFGKDFEGQMGVIPLCAYAESRRRH